ncbi:MAG: hypothetical protein JRE18_00545 [Deltaproteobacteria bacterium]|jgi:LuxR family maltose regulon positive regulatory protein|nr:hypothetical protein [Deltaproteobacteria bacterium]
MTDSKRNFLTTKIYRPPLPADYVRRSDLLHLLDAGRSRPLILVSAPAGYGKSILVSSWLEESDWASAWVSLDEKDSNLKRFLSYLSAAVHEQFPQALTATKSLSQAAVLPKPQVVTNIVGNELDSIDRPFFLVLDDYHHIHASSPIHDLVRSLLNQPPIPLHLVLVTRRDPPVPIASLRALGQVTDVRMQDLRFSASETKVLLEQIAQFRASEEALANLDRQLEGWVAGLRLLTLALRRTPDAEVFIKKLRGGTKQMQEYLMSEVVAGLPKPLRAWLLRSALLERFCIPLCEAMCFDANKTQAGAITGQKFLEHLRKANLFLISLDANEQWFRFHHLFQKMLQLELFRREDAETIAALHMRASHWFEENGFIKEAIKSAMNAGDLDAAADVLKRHWLDELENLNFHIIEHWLELLGSPTERWPELQLAEAFIAFHQFDHQRLSAIIEGLEPQLEKNPEYSDLIGRLSCLKGMLSFRQGNGEASLRLLQEARQLFRTSEKRGIAGMAIFHEALSLMICGQGDESLALVEDLANSAAIDSPIYQCLLIAGLVIVSFFQGDLARSANDAIRLEGLAQASNFEFTEGLSTYFQACSDLQRGNFEAAARRFEIFAQNRYSVPRHRAIDAMAGHALCCQLLQDKHAASRSVRKLRIFAQELNDTNGLEIARSSEARILLLQGDLVGAAEWAGFDSCPLPEFSDLFFAIEVPAVTRARIWIALGTNESIDRAYKLLQEFSKFARQWHFVHHIIESDTLKSLALAGLGREDEALECLAAAIGLAAQGGWMRPFLESRKPLADLLVHLNSHGFGTDFSRQLLGEIQAPRKREASLGSVTPDAQVTPVAGFYESLTPRELDVIELLAQRLRNKEISDKLFVSVETVKSHLKNIYQKLDVAKRQEAVEKAMKMGII